MTFGERTLIYITIGAYWAHYFIEHIWRQS